MESEAPVKRGRKKANFDDANAVLWLAESTGCLFYGEVARFRPEEKNMLTPPIARSLGRLPKGVSGRVQPFIDGGVILLGIGAWYLRLEQLRLMAKQNAMRTGAIPQQPQGVPQWNPTQRVNPTPTGNGGVPATPVTASNLTQQINQIVDQE